VGTGPRVSKSADLARVGAPASRRADACPYPRPFPEDFDDCPAYQGRLFVGLDLQYRPLPPTRTCRFLTVGELTEPAGTFYGRCALGDTEARLAYVGRVDRDRLTKLRALQLQLASFSRPYVKELWRLKGDQLRVQNLGPTAASPEDADLDRALRSLRGRFLREIERFLEEHHESLRELGLPPDAVLHAASITLETFIRQQTSAQAPDELPDEVLERFPSDVRELLRPVSSLPQRTT
jgi:hypothetical protein